MPSLLTPSGRGEAFRANGGSSRAYWEDLRGRTWTKNGAFSEVTRPWRSAEFGGVWHQVGTRPTRLRTDLEGGSTDQPHEAVDQLVGAASLPLPLLAIGGVVERNVSV